MTARLTKPLSRQRVENILLDMYDVIISLGEDYPAAHDLMEDWSGGPIASGSGGNGSRGSGHSDPTERAVTECVDHNRELDPGRLMLIARDQELIDLREAFYGLRNATLGLVDPKALPEEECELCARHGVHRAVLRTRKAPEEEGEPKPKPVKRCYGHDNWLERYRFDAPQAISQFIADHPSAKIPLRLIRENLAADDWQRFHGTNYAHGGAARR